jgi:hypothetical protein
VAGSGTGSLLGGLTGVLPKTLTLSALFQSGLLNESANGSMSSRSNFFVVISARAPNAWAKHLRETADGAVESGAVAVA